MKNTKKYTSHHSPFMTEGVLVVKRDLTWACFPPLVCATVAGATLYSGSVMEICGPVRPPMLPPLASKPHQRRRAAHASFFLLLPSVSDPAYPTSKRPDGSKDRIRGVTAQENASCEDKRGSLTAENIERMMARGRLHKGSEADVRSAGGYG